MAAPPHPAALLVATKAGHVCPSSGCALCPSGAAAESGTGLQPSGLPRSAPQGRGRPRADSRMGRDTQVGCQQILRGSCACLGSFGWFLRPPLPLLVLPLPRQVSMPETTSAEEGRVSSSLVRGVVVYFWYINTYFFSTKVWVTRAILRWVFQVSSRKGISLRQCYSTIWWGPS